VDWISKEFLIAIIGALTIALVAICVSSPPVPSQAPKVQPQSEACNGIDIDHPSANTPASVIEHCREQNAQPRKDEAFEMIPYVGIRPGEGLLVLFTLLLWWSTRDLVVESRKTAERQLRAYISVEIGQHTLQNKALRFEFRPVVVNNGDTPASNVTIASNLGLVPPIIPPNFDYSAPKPDPATASVATIAAKKDKFHQVVYYRKLTRAELRLIKKNELVFHLFGTVFYKDIFKRDRITNFSFRINVFGRRGGTFWGSTERHNDTT
jgi:hypothetical protein